MIVILILNYQLQIQSLINVKSVKIYVFQNIIHLVYRLCNKFVANVMYIRACLISY